VTVAVNFCCAPAMTFGEVGESVTTTGGITVTVALPFFVTSACDVAVTVTVDGVGTAAGAVYKPDALMVPQAPPLQPAPETDHVTAEFAVPVTVAVNCCCVPVVTLTVAGDTETATGGITVTVALPDFVWSACEVAVTVTVAGFGMIAGAV